MLLLAIALVAFFVPVLLSATYLFMLTLLSVRRAPPLYPAPTLRFAIVVPAHDEALHIARTIESLHGVDYPKDLRRVVVVADNCTDETEGAARGAGAEVWVRTNADLRGKGYALEFAFDRLLAERTSDAVVVVDADTSVSPNLLLAFAARFDRGAKAVQAEYGVRNREASWRTRLMAIALAIFHDLRSLARERLEVSTGLRGNGMAFRTELFGEVPHDAFSVVEDVEYGIRLARAGHRVWYAGDAQVLGDMVATERESRSQRQRWEGGRLALALKHGPSLIEEGLRKKNLTLLDLAMDVLVPPLSYLVLGSVLGTFVAILLVSFGDAGSGLILGWVACLAMLAAYVSRGVLLSGAGLRGFLDLLFAPAYVVWKITLLVRGWRRSKGAWVRTARDGEKAS